MEQFPPEILGNLLVLLTPKDRYELYESSIYDRFVEGFNYMYTDESLAGYNLLDPYEDLAVGENNENYFAMVYTQILSVYQQKGRDPLLRVQFYLKALDKALRHGYLKSIEDLKSYRFFRYYSIPRAIKHAVHTDDINIIRAICPSICDYSNVILKYAVAFNCPHLRQYALDNGATNWFEAAKGAIRANNLSEYKFFVEQIGRRLLPHQVKELYITSRRYSSGNMTPYVKEDQYLQDITFGATLTFYFRVFAAAEQEQNIPLENTFVPRERRQAHIFNSLRQLWINFKQDNIDAFGDENHFDNTVHSEDMIVNRCIIFALMIYKRNDRNFTARLGEVLQNIFNIGPVSRLLRNLTISFDFYSNEPDEIFTRYPVLLGIIRMINIYMPNTNLNLNPKELFRFRGNFWVHSEFLKICLSPSELYSANGDAKIYPLFNINAMLVGSGYLELFRQFLNSPLPTPEQPIQNFINILTHIIMNAAIEQYHPTSFKELLSPYEVISSITNNRSENSDLREQFPVLMSYFRNAADIAIANYIKKLYKLLASFILTNGAHGPMMYKAVREIGSNDNVQNQISDIVKHIKISYSMPLVERYILRYFNIPVTIENSSSDFNKKSADYWTIGTILQPSEQYRLITM